MFSAVENTGDAKRQVAREPVAESHSYAPGEAFERAIARSERGRRLLEQSRAQAEIDKARQIALASIVALRDRQLETIRPEEGGCRVEQLQIACARASFSYSRNGARERVRRRTLRKHKSRFCDIDRHRTRGLAAARPYQTQLQIIEQANTRLVAQLKSEGDLSTAIPAGNHPS